MASLPGSIGLLFRLLLWRLLLRLAAQKDGLSGGVVANLHSQQLADGPDGQVVGLASSGIGKEDGAGDLLPIGGGDVLPGGDLRLCVQGDVDEVIAHLAAGRQGGGAQGQQQHRRGKSSKKRWYLFFS